MSTAMSNHYTDLPYGAGSAMQSRRVVRPALSLGRILALPLAPIFWLFRVVKRHRDRRFDKLNKEILALRSEVKGLRLINSELLKFKENAEVNDHRKTQFLARITHELRTPLTAVVGFADLVQQEPYGELGNPRYAEYIADIRRTSSHMLDVVNDLLDVAKIEAGQTEINEAWMTLPMLLDDCRRLVQTEAEGSGIALKVRSADHLPGLFCDPARVRQIMANLLANAIKFTPKRGTIVLEAESDKQGGIVISVSDTGIGIPKDELDRLFEPYAQIKVNGIARTRQGSGLGLSLVRILADQHQASLEVESAENQGTRISVRFPPTRVKRIV